MFEYVTVLFQEIRTQVFCHSDSLTRVDTEEDNKVRKYMYCDW